GPNPKGLAIFDPGGHFVIVVSRSDLPRFASSARMQGTAAENKAIIEGSFAIFGTYQVRDNAIIEHCLSPAWRNRTPSPEKCQRSLGLAGCGGRGSSFFLAAIWSDLPHFTRYGRRRSTRSWRRRSARETARM